MTEESGVFLIGRDELTAEKIADYVTTLGSIKGVSPKVSSFVFPKARLIALAHEGNYEWIVWNGYDIPMTACFTFKCKNYDLRGPEVQRVLIEPFGAKRVSSISIKDKYQRSVMSYSANAKLHEDEESLQQIAKLHSEQLSVSLNEFLSKTGLTCSKLNRLSLQEIVSLCEAHQVRFFAPDFPAAASSVFNEQGAHPFPVAVWYRPEDFFIGSFKLYDGIDPNDVGQGRLGDCWLCCSISSLAENPNLIKRNFANTFEANPTGVYEMILYPMGIPKRFIVDDLFPCQPGQGPLFMNQKDAEKGELWAMLLEKAYANLCGSYWALKSGQPAEAFSTLTGLPVVHHSTSEVGAMSDNELWALLEAYSQQVRLLL
jgi:hypothetical protein